MKLYLGLAAGLVAMQMTFVSPAQETIKDVVEGVVAEMTDVGEAGALTEDFESQPLQNWELVDGAAVKQVGRGMVLNFAGPGSAVWMVPPTRNVTLRFLLRPNDATGRVVFMASGEPPNHSEYALVVSPDELALERTAGGKPKAMGKTAMQLPPTTWSRVLITARRGALAVRVGDTEVLTATDPQPLPAGVIGFSCVEGEGLSIDNVSLNQSGGAGGAGGGDEATPIPLPGAEQAAGTEGTAGQIAGAVAGATRKPGGLRTVAGDTSAGSPVYTSGSLSMAGSYGLFLKLEPDVPGDGTAQGYEGWISLLHYRYGIGPEQTQSSWGNPGNKATSGEAGAWKVPFSALIVAKALDRGSPKLHLLCATGEVMVSATLVVAKTDGPTIEPVMTSELSHPSIIGLRATGPDGAMPPTEEFGLTFDKITWTYWPGKSGAAGGPVKASFDLKAGKGQ